MRKLFARRWVTIAAMATGLAGLTAGLTAPSASASWDFQQPPDGSLIVGPGCGNDYGGYGGGSWGTWNAVGAGWYPTSSADYPGPDAYQDNLDARGACDGTSYNALTQPYETAAFSWAFHLNGGAYPMDCQIYAYIPSVNAGDYDTRYDFWTEDYGGTTRWLGWPVQTINQEPLAGWIHIGDLTVPANTWILMVTLTNADPAAPDRWAGAGDMAFWCT